MEEKSGEIGSLGIIIARTQNVGGNAQQAVELGLSALQKGRQVGIMLISDGIWNSLKGSGTVSEKLEEVIAKGGKVYLSGEHCKAGGLPMDKIIEGTETVDEVYGALTDMVMETWDKVIIC